MRKLGGTKAVLKDLKTDEKVHIISVRKVSQTATISKSREKRHTAQMLQLQSQKEPFGKW
jgi:hypothetical protein